MQTCLGASFATTEDGLETFETDSLPLSEANDQQQPAQFSEESIGWDEWDDYEEDTVNRCNLTSFEENNRASYLCQDGTAWSVDIEQIGDESCIYSRTVKTPSGANEIKKAAVSCANAQEWLEDLVQYEVFSGIPDMFLFNSRNSDGENTENSPKIIYESFPTPICRPNK